MLVLIWYYLSIHSVFVWYVFCIYALWYFVVVFLRYVLLKSRNRHSCIYIYIFIYTYIHQSDGGQMADEWRTDGGSHVWICKVGMYGGLLNIKPMRNCHIYVYIYIYIYICTYIYIYI